MQTLVRKKQFATSWPVTYRLLTTGTLVAYTAIGCQIISAAQAPPNHQTVAAPSARRIDIPAGLLRDAVRTLAGLTNLSVTMTNEGIGMLTTVGASGLLTPEQALDLLLKNTGVHWRFTTGEARTKLQRLYPARPTAEAGTNHSS